MSAYTAWLKKSGVQRCMLAVLKPSSGGSSITLRIASHTFITDGGATPPNTLFQARIMADTEIERGMGSALQRDNAPGNGGELVVTNHDGALDAWISYDWAGQSAILLYGDPSWSYGQFETIFNGLADGIQAHGQTLRIPLRDRSAPLDGPAQQTVQWGGPDIGQLQPICYGYPKNVPPLLYDNETTPSPHLGVAESGFDCQDVCVSRYVDQVPSTTPSIDKLTWFGADNVVHFLGDPGGTVTLDVKGIKSSGTWLQSPGEILQHLLTRTAANTVGLAADGGSDYMDLDDRASSVDGTYDGVTLDKGRYTSDGHNSYEGQAISSYVGASRRATVPVAWSDVAAEGDGYQLEGVSSRLGPFDLSDLDTASFGQLDTDLGSPQIGLYISGNETYSEILSHVLGIGAWYGWNRSGKLAVGLLTDPAVETPVLTIAENAVTRLSEWEIDQADPPAWRVRVGYDRNYSVSDSADGTTPERSAWIAKEYRYTPPRTDYTVRTATPKARDLKVDTALTEEAAAVTERNRIAGLLSTPRHIYHVPTFADPFQLDLGDVIEYQDNAYGLSAGKNLVVVGIIERPLAGQCELELWG